MNNRFNDTTAVILAGGMGTRLKSAVSDRPKVLAQVADKPFLVHLLEQLKNTGISKVVISTGYMADMVENQIGKKYSHMEILYSREKSPMGTGGALKLAEPHIDTQNIIVMNGDSYADVHFCDYFDFFSKKGCEIALLLVKMDNVSRFGSVCCDNKEKIIRFIEKKSSPEQGYINAGVYLMKKSVMLLIPQDRPCSLEHEIFPALIGQEFYGFCSKAKFIDIGTPESFARAESFFVSGPSNNNIIGKTNDY